MNEMLLSLFIYLVIECINHVLIYIMLFGARLTKSKKKLSLSIMSIFVIHILTFLISDLRTSFAISLITMIIIPLLFFEQINKNYIYIYPFVTLSTSIVGISLSYFFALFLVLPISDIIQGNWYTIFCQIISMIALLVLFFKVKKEKKEFYQINLGGKQFIVFYIVAISLFLMMAPIQSLDNCDYNRRSISIIGASMSLGCISLVWVTIWQAISVKNEMTSREKSLLYEKHLEIQKEYYERLLKQEEKMKRFRHDMNAHIIALLAYTENGEIKNIHEYLNRMVSESTINDIHTYTGNKIIDAVLNQLIEEAEKKRISVKVRGHLEKESATKSYDLCTILYNLLKNAIEACDKIDNQIKKNIILTIVKYDSRIYIYIKNTVKEKIIIKNKFPKSTKDFSSYHGLGFGNIKHVIDKYEGLMECHTTDNYFKVEVIL